MKADYPVLVSLAERYDLEYQDDILNCLQVTHFILFARQFYQAESNTAALSDFYFITSKHIGFKPVQITEPLTQDQVRLSYMALRDNIDPIKYKDKLRKRIFININLSKDLPTPTKPSQSSPQQVPSKKYPITIESSVSLEELQLYDDEALKKQIQREQFPRNNYSVLRHESKAPLSVDKMRTDLIQGSRLSLLDSLHLPLSTQYLRDDEAYNLISQIIPEMYVDEAVTLLMLLTAKSTSALECLIIQTRTLTNDIDQEHLDLELGVWYKPSLELKDAFHPDPSQSQWLESHTDSLVLPLPHALVSVLKNQMQLHKESKCSLGHLLGKDIDYRVEKVLKKVKTNRPLSTAKVRSFLFLKIAYRYDAQYSMGLLNTVEFDNTHHLYYLADHETRLELVFLEEANRWLGIPFCTPQEHQSNAWVGSENVLDCNRFRERLQSRFSSLKTRLGALPSSLEELKALWNDLNCYCTLMCVASTNHRIRCNYTFTLESLDTVQGRIIICDKYHHSDSAIRVLPMANELQKQLIRFQAWKERLIAEFIILQEPCISSLNQTEIDPYFTVFSNHGIEPLGHHHISNYLGEDWSLPMNVFRHMYCQAIRRDPQGRKWAKGLMGHVNAGQHLLSNFSLLSLNDMDVIKPWLDSLLTELLGFELLPNRRTIKSTCRKLVENGYGSTPVSQKEIRKEIRKLIDPYWPTLKRTLNIENVQCLVLQQLITSLETGAIPYQSSLVIYVYQNFFAKMATLLKISLTTQYGLIIEEENLTLSTTMLSDHQFARQMKEQLKRHITTITFDKPIERLTYVILRTLIYSPIQLVHHRLEDLTNALIEQRYGIIKGLMFVTISEHKRLYLDPISSIILLQSTHKNVANQDLISRVDEQIKALFNKKKIYQWVKHYLKRASINEHQKQILKNCRIDTYDGAVLYFSQQHWPHLSSVINAYQAGQVSSHPLSHASLTRLFTNRRYLVERRAFTKQTSLLPVLKKSECDKAHIILCLTEINSLLDKLPAAAKKTELGQCIISMWHEALHLPEEHGLSLSDLRERTINEYPLVVAMSFEYLYQVSQRKGHSKNRNISPGTIKKYRSEAVLPCLDLLWDIDTESLDYEEFEEIYTLLLLIYPDKKKRRVKAERLRDFHRTCQKVFHLPSVHWHLIEPSLKEEKGLYSNANIITHQHYCDAINFIQSDTSLTETERQHCQLMLILCYRTPLRPAEAWALNAGSFTEDLRYLNVKTNRRHRVKTPAANRQIPLHLFLNDTERSYIKKISQQAARRPDEQWLFYDVKENQGKRVCTRYLTNLLKHITGDHTVRLYHCRHSFANYVFLIVCNAVQTGISQALNDWAQVHNWSELSSFRDALLTELVGDPKEWQKAMFGLAKVMGHCHPRTTLGYYIHVLDLQLYIEQARSNFQERGEPNWIDREPIAKWAALSPAAFRKTLSREKAIDWKLPTVISKSEMCKTWEISPLPALELTKQHDVTELPIFPEEMFDQYLQINELLHQYLYRNYHSLEIDIQDTISSNIQSVSDQLKVSLFLSKNDEIKYFFTNKIQPNSLLNYNKKRVVLNLLSRVSSLTIEHRNRIIDIFILINKANAKYCFQKSNEAIINEFSTLLGINYKVNNKEIKVKLNNRLEQMSTASFYFGEGDKKSINQQLAYVCVIIQLEKIHF